MGKGERRDDVGGSRRPRRELERLYRDGLTNAVLAWLLISLLVLVFVGSLLGFDLQWTVFVAASGAVALVPPLAYREWKVMLPWELLALALLPILVRATLGGTTGTFASYLAVAGLALIVTVELHTFTSLQVSHWFAVALVVLTTMASVAAWAIVRWNLNHLAGTGYLTTNEALMTEFVWVTLAGFAAGLLFDTYFRWRDRQLRAAIEEVVNE